MPRHRRGWTMKGEGREREQSHTALTVAILEPALLTLLNEQPRHGYSLLADLAALGMGTIHPSVVYRTLREMEDLEWIQSDWDTSQTQGPPRRTYRLTPQGDVILSYWRLELERTQEKVMQLLKRLDQQERR